MRVLILNYEFPPLGGGAGNATYYLLKEFATIEGISLDLVTSSVKDFRIEKFSNNIQIHYLDIGKKGNLHNQSNKNLLTYSFKAYKYAQTLIKGKAFDLIHAFFGIPCGYIAWHLKLPYIVSLRGSDVPYHNPKYALVDRCLFSHLSKKIWLNSQSVIANSTGLKETALKTNLKQPIEIIYNGVNINKFKPAATPKNNSKLILISVGRLSKIKGYDYLIHAIKGLKNIELQLIGNGPAKEELQNLAKKEDVNVVFWGRKDQNEVITYLQKADIFVLSSLNEGMSNALLEALACALPVIVTDVGGSKELVKGNGFVIPKASIEALREKVKYYINNSPLLKIHGKKSRMIAEKMSWKNVAEEYLDIYKKVGR